MTQLNNFRKKSKNTERELKCLTSRIAFIQRHSSEVQKQKIKILNSTRSLSNNNLPNISKCVNLAVCNKIKAQQMKNMKHKNNILLQRNKSKLKLSNQVKRHNVIVYRQTVKESLLRCQKQKQQNADNFRKQKLKKLIKSKTYHQRLRTQLIQQQNKALQRLDFVLNQKVRISQSHPLDFITH